jgi:hypothetical protein
MAQINLFDFTDLVLLTILQGAREDELAPQRRREFVIAKPIFPPHFLPDIFIAVLVYSQASLDNKSPYTGVFLRYNWNNLRLLLH